MEISILEWNVNCATGSKTNGRENLCSLFSEKPEYEIIILTEFFQLDDYDKFEERFEKWGYDTFVTAKKEKCNDVFIAIKKDFRFSKMAHDDIIQEKKDNLPNLLMVSGQINGITLVVAGIRFRFFGNSPRDCYENMKKQFTHLLPYIVPLENTVVAGDFNNARIHGDEHITYTDEEIDICYKGLDHSDYNYHRVKLWFSGIGYDLVTPRKGCSYPKSGNKIDHFATKNIKILNSEYLTTNLSDHNQLHGIIML